MIDLTLDVEQYDCPFVHASDVADVVCSTAHWEYDTAASALEARLIVEGEDRYGLDDGLTALRDHEGTEGYDLISKSGAIAHVRTVIDQTAAMRAIRSAGGFVTGPFHVEDGSELWHVGFDDPADADGALAELERDNEFDVVSREEPDLPELQGVVRNAGAAMTLIEGCQDLSDVERETIETAAAEGYFDSPRDATLSTLADRFDVSKPAVSKNLRRGQRKMLQRVVDALEELDGAADGEGGDEA